LELQLAGYQQQHSFCTCSANGNNCLCGGAFLRQILTDKDEAFVISFDISVDLLQDFTRDTHRLQMALNKAKVNVDYTSGGIPGMGGGPVPTHNAPQLSRGRCVLLKTLAFAD